MRIKQTTLTVTEPEKKQSYWKQKTKSAQWSQICAGVICVVGFLLIFSITLTIAIDSRSSYVLSQHVTSFISRKSFPDKQSKCEIDPVTERLIVCRKIGIDDDISAEVEKLYEEFPSEGGKDYVNLILEDISVKNGILAENWISSSRYFISSLQLTSEYIYNIENGAFKNAMFSKIKILTIEKVTLNSLGKKFFEGLISLEQLSFRKCNIKEIQSNALEILQHRLYSLQVQEMQHLWDPLNLTGTAVMHGLKSIDFSSNMGFSTKFNIETFSGSNKVVQLYLMDSHITEIGEKAFVPMEYLSKIHLERNDLRNLNKNVFNLKTLNYLQIDGNRWNCSCDLEWLKTLNEKGIAKLNPVCYPSREYFNKTIFCEDDPCSTTTEPDSSSTEITTEPDETTVTDSSTISSESTTIESTTVTDSTITTESSSTTIDCTTDESTSTDISSTETTPESVDPTSGTTVETIDPTPATTTETTVETINPTTDIETTTETTTEINFGKIYLECINYGATIKSSRRKLLSNSRHIANSTIDFEISDNEPGTVEINIVSALYINVALLWFPIDPKNTSVLPKCMTLAIGRKKESNEINVDGLTAGKSYTFCFVNDNEETIPPLNCKSHFVKRLTKDETWIPNGSKDVVIIVAVSAFIIACLISALLMYSIVRKYPKLMRGSKRVVMVKHKNVDLLVLPSKFNDVQPEIPQMRHPEPELRKNRFRRSVSESSMESGSYISPIEPTVTQILNFRLERLRNKCNDNIIDEIGGDSEYPPTAPVVPPRPSPPIENWDCGSFSGFSNFR